MHQVYNWGDPVIGVHRTYLSSNIKPIDFINLVHFHTAAIKNVGNLPISIREPMSPYDDAFFK